MTEAEALAHGTDVEVAGGVIEHVVRLKGAVLKGRLHFLMEHAVSDVGLHAAAGHEPVVLFAPVAGTGADFAAVKTAGVVEGPEAGNEDGGVSGAPVDTVMGDELVFG